MWDDNVTLLSMTLTTKVITDKEVRVPDPEAGEVTVISRYGKERAMVVHPNDFQRLNKLDRLLAEASEFPPGAPSAAAFCAHHEEGTPGEPITDPAALAELFD